jgi:prepilin-type processing-associated H-X9-DG protein
VPWTPKEQYGARSYSQIRQLTRDAGTDMSRLIVVVDGAYAVRQLTASPSNQDGLLDPYRWVHPGPRVNILFGDSHVEGKTAKELKSKSVPTATGSVTYNANVLFVE